MKKKSKKDEGSLSNYLIKEIRESILVDVVWGIITFIPRVIIRIVKNIF